LRLYNIPFGKGSGALNKIVQGWSLSPIFSWYSGLPQRVAAGGAQLTGAGAILAQSVDFKNDPVFNVAGSGGIGTNGNPATGGSGVNLFANPQNVRMGGFQMLLAGDILRAKFRNSFSKPEPMVPGQPTRLEFPLGDRYHTFLKGHRIMVQVQSSWFPMFDRNPQKFVDIYHANDADYQKATQTIYRSSKLPSYLTVSRMK
jgi:hypothetical protein